MSSWKKVSDLPPHSGDYLLMLGDGQMAVGYWDAWKTWSCSGVYATYDGCGGVAFDSAPKYWTTLPSPPSEESK